MVSTNSTGTDLDFKVKELATSELPEDRELAEKATQQMEEILAMLVPVLKYIDGYIDLTGRGIVVAAGARNLVLLRDGTWTQARSGKNGNHEEWKAYSFEAVLEGLQSALGKAAAKRAAHLQIITARKDLLDGIRKVIAAAKKK